MSQPVTFFKAQQVVHPRAVTGRYRTLKWLVMAVLLGIYYLTPWIRWDRGEGVPDQAILIDMAARRAYFFFIEIWPQEVYYLTGILVTAAVSLFLITSLLGRVWCGYTCFQTVWTDLFVHVERFFQGDRNAHIKLDEGPWNLNKLWRKAATHICWLLIGLGTGGAFVFYFNDAPTLTKQILTLSVPVSVYVWIAGLTFSTYLMAGFAREQVCFFMCPYGRFQSGMFDRDTLIVSYDAERGEPRSPHKKGETWEGRGACVDCGLCVHVCPVGIDIREGLQMQCIACALCIDACNGVMDKVGQPRGLVRYDTENNVVTRKAAHKEGKNVIDRLRLIRPRTIYYAAILTIVGSVIVTGLVTRPVYDLHALHERNPLFVHLSGGAVRNNYTIKILNKTHQKREFALTTEGLPQNDLRVDGAGNPDPAHLVVPSDAVGTFRITLAVPAEALATTPRDFTFRIVDAESGKGSTATSIFVTGEK
jgi:cytochrome c oxidase accessory protein FixG